MTYNVRCYKNTGFNPLNLPDSPALLVQMTFEDFPAIDILQDQALASVTIRATKSQTENIDYVKIGNYYYTCVPHMTSPDVCTLSLELDCLMSMGGVSNLIILDGITERHHTATDSFGEYREPDGMLVPNRPLEIVSAGIIEPAPTDTERIFVQSSVDLPKQGEQTAGTTYTGTDEAGNTITVTVPDVVTVEESTKVNVLVPGLSETGGRVTDLPGTKLFDGTNAKVTKGISGTRKLGLEASILNQYRIPSGYASGLPSDDGDFSLIIGGSSRSTGALATGLPYQYATVKNQRLLYGDNNDYVIVSPASGNAATFCPEDIYHEGDTAPTVSWFTDPRPDGKPFYRFTWYRGSNATFVENCIPGLTWQNAPLVYTDKSGSTLDSFRFETDQRYTAQAAEMNVASTKREIAVQQARTTGGILGGVLGFNMEGLGNSLKETQDFASETARKYQQYERTGVEKIFDYGVSQTVVVPQINFPRSESIRDFIGNGVMVYRLRYHPVDLTRLDKKLTMYGYKTTDVLEKSFFTNRQYFNFVLCQSVSLGGNFPLYIREGAARQLEGGVRIWHVKPDTTYYTTGNPIKS